MTQDYKIKDISLAELWCSRLQLVITDPTNKVIGEVNYDEMDLADGYALRYVFQPIKDWPERLGPIQSREYTVKILVNNRMRWREQFEVHYDSDAQRIVENARRLFELGNLKGAEAELVKAIRYDPSYPDTYYIAGLVSELSDDFQGACQCYMEARKLDSNKFNYLIDFVESKYLQTLIEKQKVQNRQGIQFYRRLKHASFGKIEKNDTCSSDSGTVFKPVIP